MKAIVLQKNAWLNWGKISFLLSISYGLSLHYLYFSITPAVMHRDDWRHLFELDRDNVVSWIYRILKTDLGHVFIYPFALQEIGRGVWGTDEVFSPLISLVLSFSGLVLTLLFIRMHSNLPTFIAVILYPVVAITWLIPMGGFPFWGFGAAALMLTTGAMSVIVLASLLLCNTRSDTTSSMPRTVSVNVVLTVIALSIPVLLSSGGGIAVIPALLLTFYLLGTSFRSIFLITILFTLIIIVIKILTGAPAAGHGSLRLEAFVTLICYPAAVLFNMLGMHGDDNWIKVLVVGSGLAVITAFLTIHALRQRNRQGAATCLLSAGLGIACVGWVLGLLTGIGRSDFGLALTVFPPRYGIMQMLVWIGLLIASADFVGAKSKNIPSLANVFNLNPLSIESLCKSFKTIFLDRAILWSWIVASIFFSAVCWHFTLNYVSHFGSKVGPTMREATFALLSNVKYVESSDVLFKNRALIEAMLPILKQRKIELYSLNQADLMGSRPLTVRDVRNLPNCDSFLVKEETLTSKEEDMVGVRITGAISRRPAMRTLFQDTVAVVDRGGTITGVGAFVGPFPPAYSQRETISRRRPWHVRALAMVNRTLPSMLNQDVYFVTFTTLENRENAAALVYFSGQRPNCKIRLRPPAKTP